MSTSYSIEVGYNSSFDRKKAEQYLREIVHAICVDPSVILQEARRLDGDIPDESAEGYREPWQDQTIRIYEPEHEDERLSIVQCASGGGKSREYKESMRRAFNRLVMERMHAMKIEISINVC
jgi:hypothetical protein